MTGGLAVNLHAVSTGAAAHLVNHAYDDERDAARTCRDVTLRVRLPHHRRRERVVDLRQREPMGDQRRQRQLTRLQWQAVRVPARYGHGVDLIYLYGPPAVGKLTVATELAARTGYRVFHNHLSIDCVVPVFDFGTEPFWRQVHAIREGILGEAAREGTNLICTSVFSHPKSVPLIRRRFEIVEKHGGRVCPVQLCCSAPVLEGRVIGPDRVAARKLATVEGLRRVLTEEQLLEPIPGRDSVRLDTSQSTPAESAQRIIDQYGLSVGD